MRFGEAGGCFNFISLGFVLGIVFYFLGGAVWMWMTWIIFAILGFLSYTRYMDYETGGQFTAQKRVTPEDFGLDKCDWLTEKEKWKEADLECRLRNALLKTPDQDAIDNLFGPLENKLMAALSSLPDGFVNVAYQYRNNYLPYFGYDYEKKKMYRVIYKFAPYDFTYSNSVYELGEIDGKKCVMHNGKRLTVQPLSYEEQLRCRNGGYRVSFVLDEGNKDLKVIDECRIYYDNFYFSGEFIIKEMEFWEKRDYIY